MSFKVDKNKILAIDYIEQVQNFFSFYYPQVKKARLKNEDVEIYFYKFPAFFYFSNEDLENLYIKLYSINDHYEYGEFIAEINLKIKNVILEQKSYISALSNIQHFKLPEITDLFINDESIIYFFSQSNFTRDERSIDTKNVCIIYLRNYLISEIFFNRPHLFESCFSIFDVSKVSEFNFFIDYLIEKKLTNEFMEKVQLSERNKREIMEREAKIEIGGF